MNVYSIPVGIGGAQIMTTSRAAMVLVLASVVLAAWWLAERAEA